MIKPNELAPLYQNNRSEYLKDKAAEILRYIEQQLKLQAGGSKLTQPTVWALDLFDRTSLTLREDPELCSRVFEELRQHGWSSKLSAAQHLLILPDPEYKPTPYRC